jgi:hypothetical protein
MMPEREKTGSLWLAKWTPFDSFLLLRSEASVSFLVLALLFGLLLFGLFLSLCLVLNPHDW